MRRGLSLALGSLAALMFSACPRPAQPPAGATASPTSTAPPPSRDGSTTPPTELPGPDLPALSRAARDAATAAGLKGADPGPGPRIGAAVPGFRRITGEWYPKPDLPPHKTPYLIDNVEVLFSVAPWSTIEGQDLVVRFSTRLPTDAAAVYAGLRVEVDPLAPARYRQYQAESRRTAGKDHEVRMPLRKFLRPNKDVNGVLERGFGEVAWQLEVPFPGSGTTVSYDSRLAFRIDGEVLVPQPTVVLGPLVHQVTASTAIVSFETSTPTTATVGAGDSVTAVSSTPATRHEVRLTGLTPNARHPYRVAVSDGRETSLTPPRALTTNGPGPLTVAILCDSRAGAGVGMTSYNGVNAKVLSQLLVDSYRSGASAIFFPGDLIDGYVAHADDFSWQLRSWLRAAEGVHGQLPLYTTMGNHEALLDVWSDGAAVDKMGALSAEAQFARLMVNPGGAPAPEAAGAPPYDETVYALDLGGVHFVMLNTNYWYARPLGDPRYDGRGNREGTLMDGQLAWLDADLTAANERGVDHIVVMGHEPAFPVGGRTGDAMWWGGTIPEVNAVRTRFWKMLADHGVLAYVSGDEHNYSRSLIGPETVPGAAASVYSIITGGAGAPYYAFDPPAAYADRVQTFSAEQHRTVWTFEAGQLPRLRVYGLTGGLIEDVRLDP